MTLRSIFFLALMICAIALWQWLQTPLPKSLRPIRLPEEASQLLPQKQADFRQSLAALAESSLWGKLPEMDAEAQQKKPEWHFVGAVARGIERYVLVQIENQPEMKLAPGDTLPGGSKILRIEDDGLCLLINGKKRHLNIYPQMQVPQTY